MKKTLYSVWLLVGMFLILNIGFYSPEKQECYSMQTSQIRTVFYEEKCYIEGSDRVLRLLEE